MASRDPSSFPRREESADGTDLVLAHPHQDLAAVGGIGRPLDQPRPLQTVDQARHGVASQPGTAVGSGAAALLLRFVPLGL